MRRGITKRPRSVLALVVVVGLCGSVGLAGLAAARRAATAPERLLAATGGPPDVSVYDLGEADRDDVFGLPQVDSAVVISFIVADAIRPAANVIVFGVTDYRAGSQLVEGEYPRLDDLGAAVIDTLAAEQLGVDIGDDVEIGLYTGEQFFSGDVSGGPTDTATVTVRAIVRESDDITARDPAAAEQVGYAGIASLYVGESFIEANGALTVNDLIGVRLVEGPAGRGDFVAAVRELDGGETVQFFETSGLDEPTQRAVDGQALAVAILATVFGIAATLVCGQMLSRHLRRDGGDGRRLTELGMTGRERVAVTAATGAVVGLGGAAVAVLGSVAWSSLAPFGIARGSEPAPGVDVDPLVVSIGAAAIVIVMAAAGALAGFSQLRAERKPVLGPLRPSLADRAARSGMPATLVAACSLVAHRDRRLATSTAAFSVALSLTIVVASVTVAASFDDLTDAPRRTGWTFDAVAGTPFTGDAEVLRSSLAPLDIVGDMAIARDVAVMSGRHEFAILGIESGQGVPLGRLQDGREPKADDEVALGLHTLDDLDAEIGDAIEVDAGAGPQRFRIVGTTVVPEVGSVEAGVGRGGVVTIDALRRLTPDAEFDGNVVLFDLRREPTAAEVVELREASGGLYLRPVMAQIVYTVYLMRALPLVLAAMLAALAMAASVHFLLSTLRSRRRDLGVLATLGMDSKDLGAVAVWLAVGVASVPLLVALPLGAVLGHRAWIAVVDVIGLEWPTTVPFTLLALLVPGALLVALVAAAVPAIGAARTRPATALRSE